MSEISTQPTYNNVETDNIYKDPEVAFEGEVMDGASQVNRTDPHEVLAELSGTLDNYRNSPSFHGLIRNAAIDRGLDIQDVIDQVSKDKAYDPDNFFQNEDVFMDVAQEILDERKGGKSRHDLVAGEMSDTTKQSLDEVKELLGMNRNTVPVQPEAEMVFVLGGAGATPANRLKYTIDMIERGELKTNVIVMVGCERPLVLKRNPSGENELDRAGEAATNSKGELAETESDLMRNTAENVLGFSDDDTQVFEGFDPRVPAEQGFHRDWKITYADIDHPQLGALNIFATSAPMLGDNRFHPDGKPRNRANTSDTMIMMAEMNRDVNPDKPIHTIVVTDAIFTAFQGPDAKGAMAPYGISSETVGYNREYAGLEDWSAGDTLYKQEVLSALRQTRAARNTLRAKLEKTTE